MSGRQNATQVADQMSMTTTPRSRSSFAGTTPVGSLVRPGCRAGLDPGPIALLPRLFFALEDFFDDPGIQHGDRLSAGRHGGCLYDEALLVQGANREPDLEGDLHLI
ncbi:MAG: hypothetical protein R2939_13255 [Kofleriaceae bacterium]